MKLGYALSSEEHRPLDLVEHARRAEEAGFSFALVSDEHVLGDRWPAAEIRREMLEEAVAVMRQLWEGELTSHRGDYYTVENARLYTVPEEPIEVMVAAGGPEAAELAGRIGDGFVGTAPEAELLEAFEAAGGEGKPRYGQLTVCWAEDEAEARRTAHEWWPNAALKGTLGQELPLPSHFEAAAAMVTEDDVAEAVVCGPDPERHAEAIDAYVEAGYDHVYVHQVGPDQEGFLRCYERELLPRYARASAGAR